ncbi:unnamed protein product [Vitrella brassicaformis CCMP3155]|uniref:Uncharacterized protein n=1 Tax=Vitrella brassicaformis (strain CCMP3155) TaxID=1169540 RepID=A0A0G4E9K4_VITBC|nr:unnamed protein product [Vitrella brassicaformis CCMP3155]|eukprot:CEL92569.1 unnamed protein product [Vitrella brassicaformis CCMP3155]
MVARHIDHEGARELKPNEPLDILYNPALMVPSPVPFVPLSYDIAVATGQRTTQPVHRHLRHNHDVAGYILYLERPVFLNPATFLYRFSPTLSPYPAVAASMPGDREGVLPRRDVNWVWYWRPVDQEVNLSDGYLKISQPGCCWGSRTVYIDLGDKRICVAARKLRDDGRYFNFKNIPNALLWGPIDISPSLIRQFEASPILAHTVKTDQCLLSLPLDEARAVACRLIALYDGARGPKACFECRDSAELDEWYNHIKCWRRSTKAVSLPSCSQRPFNNWQISHLPTDI